MAFYINVVLSISRPLFGFVLLVLTSACISKPTPQDYLDVGFQSPEQAFRSFQTALAGNQLDLEYRCLGQGFRADNELDGLTYRLAREEMLKENPFIRWVAMGEVVDSERMGERHHRLTVRVKNWIADESFYVYLEREDYFEAFVGERSAFFDFAPFEDHVFIDENDPSVIFGIAQAPPEIDPTTITELNFGRDWRIAGFEQLPKPENAPPSPPSP